MGIQQNSHCSGKKPSTSLNYRLQIENSSNRKLSSTVLLGDKSKDPGESQKKSKSQGESWKKIHPASTLPQASLWSQGSTTKTVLTIAPCHSLLLPQSPTSIHCSLSLHMGKLSIIIFRKRKESGRAPAGKNITNRVTQINQGASAKM